MAIVDGERISAQAFPWPVVDTTGAGDLLVAALHLGRARGASSRTGSAGPSSTPPSRCRSRLPSAVRSPRRSSSSRRRPPWPQPARVTLVH